MVGDDIHTALTSTDPKTRAVAIAMLVLDVMPEGRLVKLLRYAPWVIKAFAKVLRYVAEAAHIHIAPGIAEMAARLLQKGRSALRRVGCAGCFAAGTLVATPHGLQAIQMLRVGQQVVSEDPTTGVTEPEAVQAVIADPAAPLMAVDLSDGSAITATLSHPFWVDGEVLIKAAGWFAAGDLRPGDRLRTAGGRDIKVLRVRRGVGDAPVGKRRGRADS